MRTPLIAGNWKLNGSLASAAALTEAILAGLEGIDNAEVAVCPPYVFLPLVREHIGASKLALGAQDVCDEDAGAFTGEVSAPMLRELGCRYVIVGHSERRGLYEESDALVARKLAAARRSNLTPIFCVGETLAEREANETEAVIARQLDAVLDDGEPGFADAVIAYEPVWAIGTGRTATPAQAQGVHALIRARVAERQQAVGEALRILYGGSVKGTNAGELFAEPDIDGGLIGGAALDAEEFLNICQAA